jgi:Flp pilus assembly protein CpaB
MAVVAPEARPLERTASPTRREPRRRRRRPLTERLTLNVVVGLVAALLAFVLAASLLADRREMVAVAVATERIPAGSTITATLVRSVELPADTEFADSLVPPESVADGSTVATRTIQAGEPLTTSAIGASGSVTGQRVMSIPLEPWQAANGELQVGDTVDVIEAARDGSRYVLTNASVVGRSGGDDSGGLVGGSRASELVILVEVDGPQALDLAAAIEAGTIMVVRSTGAAPITDVVAEEVVE